MPLGRAELAQHARVEELVPDPNRDPADDRRVHDELEPNLVTELTCERGGQRVLLLFAERHRRGDAGDEPRAWR